MSLRSGKKIAAAALMAAWLLVSGRAWADLSWASRTVTTVRANSREENLGQGSQNYSLKQNLLRIDDLGENGGARFYNFFNQTAVLADFDNKTFLALPMSELIRQTREQREGVKADLPAREQDLENMPLIERNLTAAQIEAQRKKFEIWAKPYQVKPTADRAVIAGHPCSKYEGLAGGESFQEIWVADDIKLDPAYQLYFAKGMAALDPQEFSHLPLIPKFPMKVVTHYGAVTVTIEVQQITTSPIPLDAFILPPDLKSAQMKTIPGKVK